MSKPSTCSIPDCGRVLYAKSLCHAHYERNRLRGGPNPDKPIAPRYREEETCAVETCNRKAKSLRYCTPHYRRFKTHGDVLADIPLRVRVDSNWPEICLFPECGKPMFRFGYCTGHDTQIRRQQELMPLRPRKSGIRLNSTANRWVTSDGYAMVRLDDGRTMLEHRVVMEESIGRPLLSNENVHHRNGRKADNRQTNLELWVISQPPGQRVSDLIAWAHEILDRYEGE